MNTLFAERLKIALDRKQYEADRPGPQAQQQGVKLERAM